MRCGASGEPKTGVCAVFQPYHHFIRVKSCSQWPFNFGQAREKSELPAFRSTLGLPFPPFRPIRRAEERRPGNIIVL